MARIGNIPKSQLYGGTPYNAFDRQPPQARFEEEASFVDEAAMADAADADGSTDLEVDNLDREKLLHMNIDDLRVVAKQLDIPDREHITEKSELVAAIQRSL